MTCVRRSCIVLSMLQLTLGSVYAAPPQAVDTRSTESAKTRSPIKHVTVIIGENRTFDHVFATYKPRGESVDNLLSREIVNEDGTPGPNYALALQYSAVDTHDDGYHISPLSKSI